MPEQNPGRATPKAKRAGKLLRLFAKLGFEHLLAAVFEFHNTDDMHELLSQNELDGKPADSPLFLACQRELPNMDVVRLLVDTGHVDVNVRNMTTAQRAASLEGTGLTEDEDEPDSGRATVLHELACGRHWWGVTQAIPYLLSKGADREMSNEADQTPLKLAEEYLPRGTFETEAIEALRA